jgi:hypothetical protein
MVLTIGEMKELVLFAKKERLSSFSFGGVQITISPAAYIESLPTLPEIPPEQRELEAKREAEEILFHSSG